MAEGGGEGASIGGGAIGGSAPAIGGAELGGGVATLGGAVGELGGGVGNQTEPTSTNAASPIPELTGLLNGSENGSNAAVVVPGTETGDEGEDSTIPTIMQTLEARATGIPDPEQALAAEDSDEPNEEMESNSNQAQLAAAGMRELGAQSIELALSGGDLETALLALSGKPYQEGFAVISRSLEQAMQPEGPANPSQRLKNAWDIVSWPVVMPIQAMKRGAIQASHTELREVAHQRAREANAAVASLERGTPHMQALALDIRINGLRAQMTSITDAEEVQSAQANLNLLQARRQNIEVDGEPIPNQILPMAQELATHLEEDGQLPEGVAENPMEYVGKKMESLILDKGERGKFLSGLRKNGHINRRDEIQLERLLQLAFQSPREKLLKKLAIGMSFGAILMVLAVKAKLASEQGGAGGRQRAGH